MSKLVREEEEEALQQEAVRAADRSLQPYTQKHSEFIMKLVSGRVRVCQPQERVTQQLFKEGHLILTRL